MPEYLTSNTILYCKKWEETVVFYRDTLALSVTFSSDWFVEFALNEKSRLSIADQEKASIKANGGKAITMTFQVPDIEKIRHDFLIKELNPTPIRNHPWKAKTFYLYDPEGHRLEFWQSI